MKATFKQMKKRKRRGVPGPWSHAGKWSNWKSKPGPSDFLACAINYTPTLLSAPQGALQPLEQAQTEWGQHAKRGVGQPHCSGLEMTGIPVRWGGVRRGACQCRCEKSSILCPGMSHLLCLHSHIASELTLPLPGSLPELLPCQGPLPPLLTCNRYSQCWSQHRLE